MTYQKSFGASRLRSKSKIKFPDLERSREARKVKPGRLKAFTLADVLSGMVIMSIVVAMVFGVFNMVNRQTHDFQNLRVELNDFVLMQADLNRQIDACEKIYEIPSGFVLDKDGNEIRYFISEGQTNETK